MLKSLKIANLALIEDVSIEFDKGLMVLSGETGAGKSIILNSLNLLTGEQARTDLIRTGKDKAEIEAVFDITEAVELKQYLKEELGIETEENLLIINRDIDREKGSSAFINNRRLLVQTLKNIGRYLIDMHSQHQHQSLFDKNNHLKLLDRYAGLEKKLAKYQEQFQKALHIHKSLKEKIKLEEEKESFLEFATYAVEEIQNSHLIVDEEEKLEQELKKLTFYQEIQNAIRESFELLYHQDKSAIALLQKTFSLLDKIKEKEKEVKQILPFLQDAMVKLEPVIDFIRSYQKNENFTPEDLEKITKRIEMIHFLKKKYNQNSITDLLKYKENLEKEIAIMEKNKDSIAHLEQELNTIRDLLAKEALEISQIRRQAAQKLETAIQEELRFLGMEKVRFLVHFEYLEDEEGKVVLPDGRRVKISKDGIEKVEFLFSSNLGEEVKPLSKIASGGELSRIMLAIKNILAKIDPILVLIFDEIDTGIGGETAFAVGKKMKEIASFKQVLCITHLPQIASMAKNHYLVIKKEENNRTKTLIKRLSEEERIREISRMLSGEQITEITIEHAKQFLEKNVYYK